MVMFSLERFLESPSLEELDSCRKDDLVMIASHFQISVNKNALKKEIKSVVCNRLVELNVLVLPENATVGDSVEVDTFGRSENVSEEDLTPMVEAEAREGLPPFEPFSPMSVCSKEETRLKVRLARLQLDSKEKVQARQAEMNLRLQIRKFEIEAETQVKMRQLELDAMRIVGGSAVLPDLPRVSPAATDRSPIVVPTPTVAPTSASSVTESFDVGKNITLVPHFRETEVDSYFSAFERIAMSFRWPKECWALLLQCRLCGKALEVFSTLSLEDSLSYDAVKLAILRAYELVPEAYRQKFRGHKKNSSQTFVEFSREKALLFDKWCSATKTDDFNSLRELVLLEEFKGCLSERVVVYLNEQKVSSLSQAAVLADEFMLTHKGVFCVTRTEKSVTGSPSQTQGVREKSGMPKSKELRDCFYCHKTGHLIADCPVLIRKQQSKNPKSVALVKTLLPSELSCCTDVCDINYKPFVMPGFVSLSGKEEDQKEICILRDTGAMQSIMLSDVLPFSDESYCGSNILIHGIEMQVVSVPLHNVHLQCTLVSGVVRVGIRTSLPVKGITLILGNDLAGGKVLPAPEVTDVPQVCPMVDVADLHPEVFSACAVTRAQSGKTVDEVDLADSLMGSALADDGKPCGTKISGENVSKVKNSDNLLESFSSLDLPVTRSQIIMAQNDDPSLSKCLSAVISSEAAKKKNTAYFIDNGLLMRKWCSKVEEDLDWNVVYQVVVPNKYRSHVLWVAHEHLLSGHLGVTKTYQRILQHFFWPGLKRDVAKFCRTCRTCQIAGKPNQVISPAPLSPIPVIGEAFEEVLVDCVGPLPKTKAGNQYLCTIMCRATRFPEAIPLRKITAPVILKVLTKFFSTFGLPKVVQTDQGTNFLSRVFTQTLKSLSIEHRVSSAYHPESQGAIERFHQTLKSMLRKFCMDTSRDWDEGIPLVLFAVRESVQESLGFSPAEMVFGHTLRGPLKVLKEQMMESKTEKRTNVLDYVSRFREKLHSACDLARKFLKNAQSEMKDRFDRHAVARSFQPDDKVVVLLPIPGSALSARFTGPYSIVRKLSDTDYVICTPERRRKTRVCHINMLKAYHDRDVGEPVKQVTDNAAVLITSKALSVVEGDMNADEDGLVVRNTPQQCSKLDNSVILSNLTSQLSSLPDGQRHDVVALITSFPVLFSDVPSQTRVLQHDIDVRGAKPIKQHPYRVNEIKRSAMKTETDYLLENDLARHSYSPWSSPCLLVKKPDGSFRFCTDYRKVNAVTVPDCYPLPRMEDCVDSIGSARFVSKLDLLKGYWQVPLTPQASDISAFVTPDCFLQYQVMAFGLRNAPATFQRLIQIVLAGVPNCKAYLDDLVIFSNDWEEHLSLLRTVFERLKHASLTLNLAKCVFGQATVTYLGKQVGNGQVKPVEEKVVAITKFPVPVTRRELRRFLGMIGYYRGFCKNFATVVTPLTNLLSPKQTFVWSEECQVAFENAKALMCTSPVLAAPQFDRAFKLEVDASAVGAGAVLIQEGKDGVDHPVCFFSRKFNKHQANYSTIEKETLALLLALQFFEVYLGSSSLPTIVFTDHHPLVFLSRMYNANQRLMRWALFVQNYHLEIHHKKGSENILADALSRG